MGGICRRHGKRERDTQARSLKVTHYFGNLEIDGTMILFCNFKKFDAMVLKRPVIRSISGFLNTVKESAVCLYDN